MQFTAKSRFIRYSPYKLRPLVDVIRGKNVEYALGWLNSYATKRSIPIIKIVESAASNARHLNNVDTKTLIIKEIRVDEGPRFRYFKPGPMGRASMQKRRLSHISIVLEPMKAREG